MDLQTKYRGGHTETIICIGANSSQHLATGAENSQICLWDQASGKVIYKTPSVSSTHHGGGGVPEGDVTSVCFSKTQPHNLYCAVDSTICLYDTRCMDTMVTKFQYNKEEINQLTLHPKDTFLAACDDSGQIRIIDMQQRKLYKTLRKHTNICSSVSFHPTLPWHLASGGLDCAVFTWDFSRGKVLNSLSTQDLNHEGSTSAHQTAYSCNPPLVHSVSYSPKGALACGLENSTIHVFDFPKRNEIRVKRTLNGHTQGVSQVCYNGDDMLLSAGNDGKIILWDMTVPEIKMNEGDTLAEVDLGAQNLSLEDTPRRVPESQSDDRNSHSETDLDSEITETKEIATVCEKTERLYDHRRHVVDHGDKINWICPVKSIGSEHSLLFVADQSEVITMYRIAT